MANNSPFTPSERDEVIAAVSAHRGLTKADAERLVSTFEERRSKRNPILERNWVKTLSAVTEALANGTAKPAGLFASIFWIRLYGAITDLRTRFQPTADFHASLIAEGRSSPFVAAGAAVHDACAAIRDELSDDELVFAAFLRQVHAHVYQDGFEYSIEDGNPAQRQLPRLRTNQMVRTIRKHVGIDEAHAVVDRICAEHANDDLAAAKAFAKRLAEPVAHLSSAMLALEAQRSQDREPSS
jgi:hypothetical protein